MALRSLYVGLGEVSMHNSNNVPLVSWIQVSDLHIFDSTDWNMMINGGYQQLAERVNPDFIVCTGDFRHKKYAYNYDYSRTCDFLDLLLGIFSLNRRDVYFVPGNHDIREYAFEESAKRKESINEIIKKIESNPDTYVEYLNRTPSILLDAFGDYVKFISSFYKGEVFDQRFSNPTGVNTFTYRDSFNIVTLNTALISDGEKNHKEIIDLKALSELKINPKLDTIVIGHHDLNSIYDSQLSRMLVLFKTWHVKAYLCGDKHKASVELFSRYDLPNATFHCIVCGKSAIEPGDTYSDVVSCKIKNFTQLQTYDILQRRMKKGGISNGKQCYYA